jgi:hypothetical protein
VFLSRNIVNPGILNPLTASEIASNAAGRGNPLRQAIPICRSGTGSAKGIVASLLCRYLADSALQGNTVIPRPEATIWRMV